MMMMVIVKKTMCEGVMKMKDAWRRRWKAEVKERRQIKIIQGSEE